jgi:hypothetical protein
MKFCFTPLRLRNNKVITYFSLFLRQFKIVKPIPASQEKKKKKQKQKTKTKKKTSLKITKPPLHVV